MSSQQKGRVLIAEDDGLVAEMIRGILEDEDYQVEGIVGDGLAALEAVARLQPDVVVMDLRMPEMDGIETTRRIQQIRPTPVVMLTAYDSMQLTSEAAAAGVGAYLVKPPNGRDLARAITVARARFEEAQSLDAFAHTVAHDLKSAMTPILCVAELLSEDLEVTSVESARQQLDMIAESGYKLGRMVDDLLMLAEIRYRDVTPRPLDMAPIVQEAQSRLASVADRLGATMDAPSTWPTVLGRESWVTEVWVNYLSNALKYGGRPPELTLGWNKPSSDKAHVRFWVRDNGSGLTSEEQAQLFARYTRLRPTEADGHGLGLSIVQQIVRKLGGSVGVESQVDRGCTFWFTLPVVP